MVLAASSSRLRMTTTNQRPNVSTAATTRFNSGRTTSRHLVGVTLPPKRTAAASSRPRVSLLPPNLPCSRSNASSAAGEGKQCSLSGHGSRRAHTPPDTKMAADESDVVSASSAKPFAPVPSKDVVEECATRTGAKEEESRMVLSLRQELSHSSRGFGALAVVLLHLTKEFRLSYIRCANHYTKHLAALIQVACLRRQLVCKSQQLQSLSLDHEQELVVLKNVLNERSLQNEASSSLYKQRLKDVEDRDKLQVVRLNTEVAETTANLRALTTAYERCKSEAQLEHEKLKEALNALQLEKNKLIDTLRKDESEKIKNLIQEVDSQKVAVELKSAEIHQLRQENTRLALQVDEFPAKEKENSTLKHKLAEVKAALDQSKKTEKLLRKQYEELNKSNQQSDRMTQSLIQENEELEYRLMLSSSRPASRDPLDGGQQTSTPSPRNRHSVCIDSFTKSPNVMSNTLPLPRKHHAAFTPSPSAFLRPPNGHAAAASYGEAENIVMRSSAVKLYQEVGRQRVSAENTPDTIYTTAGEVIVNPGSSDEEGQVAMRLTFDVEKNSNLEAVEERREEAVHFRDGRSVTLPPGVIRDEVVPRSATDDSGVGSLQSSVSGQLRFCKR